MVAKSSIGIACAATAISEDTKVAERIRSMPMDVVAAIRIVRDLIFSKLENQRMVWRWRAQSSPIELHRSP